jgi:hypothetical protein
VLLNSILNTFLFFVFQEYEAKSWVSVESEPGLAEIKASNSTINAATQTLEEVSIETCEVETLTDLPLKEEEDEATKAEEESYRRVSFNLFE